jgi:NAD(P)-dependent dehydrogenase (short-subunit alcohol dehydrogenase family)
MGIGTRLANKICLVTGATSGLGRAIALRFAEEGAILAICGRRQTEGESVQEEIQKLGGLDSVFYPVDISQNSQVESMIQDITRRWGRLDVAVNNAGVAGEMQKVGDYPLDTWNQVIQINLTGTFICMKHELNQMEKQGSGVILNMSSALGLRGKDKLAAYSSAKHGIIGLTKSASLEYGKFGIRINAICPGGIETEMDALFYKSSADPEKLKQERLKTYALGRLGRPNEIADASLWLCSDESSFVTGAVIPVDGGKTTR